jgi:uncharacterized protein (TIGR00661 family)
VKILYAIQGTGNGHIARAEDIIPELQKYGELDLFVSGAQADIELKHKVKYRSKGLSFYFGKDGGVDLMRTFRKNSSKSLYKELKNFPVEKYDFVINDFEPISAWACYRKDVPCVSLSHQSALLSPHVPRPKHFDPVGEWILKNYAPASQHVGFHFSRFDKNIYTPVIRESVRTCEVKKLEHYTVYLPAYDDKKLVPLLLNFPLTRWHVFSKHTKKPYHVNKVSVYPVNNVDFQASMASCTGVFCGAGFETPAEALYLEKKLLVVPMKKQFEQHYNAGALKMMGVPVIKSAKKKHLDKIREWLESDTTVHVSYPIVAADAVKKAVSLAIKA